MKISFVGGGKMAEAIISALLTSKTVSAHEIFVSDSAESRRDFLKRTYGLNLYSKNLAAAAMGDVVFFGIKPQNMEKVLTELASGITTKQIYVSIVAGWKISAIEGFLQEARVIRVMPNVACLVNEGMNVFCKGSKVDAEDTKTVTDLLEKFGSVLELPEHLFDVVTAISGSGPAFFAYICEAMVIAGIEMGLERAQALRLATQTMLGTGKLMSLKEIKPLDLILSVKSPQGTTAAGLDVLEKSDISEIIHDTLRAAAARSKELSSGA